MLVSFFQPIKKQNPRHKQSLWPIFSPVEMRRLRIFKLLPSILFSSHPLILIPYPQNLMKISAKIFLCERWKFLVSQSVKFANFQHFRFKILAPSRWRRKAIRSWIMKQKAHQQVISNSLSLAGQNVLAAEITVWFPGWKATKGSAVLNPAFVPNAIWLLNDKEWWLLRYAIK